ncbi:putative E3 ubiquitin-protein ligase ipaH7.8 [compost metagenome]
MNQEPCQLRTVNLSRNQITQLPNLAGTRFGADLRAQVDSTLRLDLYFNPLEAGAIARLSEVGAEFVAEIPRQPSARSGAAWLEGASPAQREVWNTLFQSRRQRALSEMLDRLSVSREFQRNAPQLRTRVWAMLELASQHTRLREELQAIAEAFPVTCGDAGADAFSDMEIAVLVFQRSSEATSSEHGAELLALYRQLFRRSEVQRRADVLSLTRTARRRALIDEGELPPLDPLDDIGDDVLRRERVDDVEIRLALRQDLAAVLDYPEPSGEMLYRQMANVTPRTVKRVEAAVRAADTTANRHSWMVEETSWQRYLKRRYEVQFEGVTQVWQDGLEYLDFCNGGDQVPATLNNEVVQVLRVVLDEEPVAPDGTVRKLELSSQVYLKAIDAIVVAQKTADAALMLRLTQLEEAAI